MNTQSGLNIGNSLEANMLTDRAFQWKVYSSWERRFITLNGIREAFMNRGGGPKQTPGIKIEVATQGGNDVYSTITGTPTTSGANLIVPVPAGHNFRVGDLVQDNNAKQGQVVSKSDTTITVSGVGYGFTSWNTATDYESGTTAVKYGMASKGKGSTSPDSLYNLAKTDFTYTQVMREFAALYRRDNVQTYIGQQKPYDFISGATGLWTAYQFREAWLRQKKFEELTCYWGSRNIANAGTAQETTYTMGIRDQIINRAARSGNNAGLYYRLNAEMTFDDWTDILNDFVQRIGPGGMPVAIIGNQAFGSFQSNITQPYIQAAGVRNTFGQAGVKGLDVRTFSYNTLSVDFTYGDFFSAPGYNDQVSSITGKGKWASSILLMDLSSVPEATGNGVMNPIETFYYGPNMYLGGIRKGLYDFADTYTRGDAMAQLGSGQYYSGDAYISDVDQVSMDIYSDQGYYIYPEKMCLIELAS